MSCPPNAEASDPRAVLFQRKCCIILLNALLVVVCSGCGSFCRSSSCIQRENRDFFRRRCVINGSTLSKPTAYQFH